MRSDETACPFCKAVLPEVLAAAQRGALGRGSSGRPLSRAAILFVGATATTACGSQDTQLLPAYGPAPVLDSGPEHDASPELDSSLGPDTSPDAEPVALYGPAILDSGSDAAQEASPDSTSPFPDGGAMASYGPVVIPDSGSKGEG
jgi:hypothetical protein